MIIKYISRKIKIIKEINEVSKVYKIKPLQKLSDYLKIKVNKPGVLEFYKFKLYDSSLSSQYRKDFLTNRNYKKYISLLNPDPYGYISRNKFFAHLFLKGSDIPTSKLFFLFYKLGSQASSPIVINSNKGAIEWFRKNYNNSDFGFVCKPAGLSYGKGVDVFKSIEWQGDSLFFERVDGNKFEFNSYINNKNISKELLFESRIKQCEYLNQLNSTSINTLRIITFYYPDGNVKVFHTGFRIGRKNSWVDNASVNGNIACSVDINTGKIIRAALVHNFYNQETIQRHPDSGVDLTNFYIRNWDYILNKVKEFQKKIPFVRAIGWDIAVTDEGPVVVELNDRWDYAGQLFTMQGWQPELSEIYEKWRRVINNVQNDP